MKFKVGDIAMYGKLNKGDAHVPGGLEDYWLKPARITSIDASPVYPYRLELLNDSRKNNIFRESEVALLTKDEDEYFGMFIRKEITKEEYEKILEYIKNNPLLEV